MIKSQIYIEMQDNLRGVRSSRMRISEHLYKRKIFYWIYCIFIFICFFIAFSNYFEWKNLNTKFQNRIIFSRMSEWRWSDFWGWQYWGQSLLWYKNLIREDKRLLFLSSIYNFRVTPNTRKGFSASFQLYFELFDRFSAN